MNKVDVVNAIKDFLGISKNDAAKTVNKFLEVITHALGRGEYVTFPGFGTFKVNNRKERLGRNPKTGEVLKIPASKVPIFKVGKGLKDAVQNLNQE